MAASLVMLERNTVVEIAPEVGFHARSSFYTAFKSVVGMMPSALVESLGLLNG